MIRAYFLPPARRLQRRACLALVCCLGTVTDGGAVARGIELQAGRSYMDAHGAAAVFVEALSSPHRIGSSRFNWSPDISFGWIDGRDLQRYRGARYDTADAVWLLAAGVRLRYGMGNDWCRHFFFSFQPALHTGRTQALSSPYEFVSSLGWQGERFSFQLRHISNGSLHQPNRGETMALLGVRFGG